MSNHNDDIKLKLAWQTAFELRTCPDSKTLHAADPDENISRHLAICHVCRDKREMQQDERDAWKALKEKFATLTMKPGIGTDKQAGQVWTIKREFGGWRDIGRYIKPPSVMLLERMDGTSGWRVAQLYRDTRLMGNGDIILDEQYGFAETWNCYTQKENRFDKCLGRVKPDELKQVITASFTVHEPAPEGSILSIFRSMEIEVGAFVAVPALVQLMEELETAHESVFSFVEQFKGQMLQMSAVASKLKNCILPDDAPSVFYRLADYRPQQLQLAAADSENTRPVNIVKKTVDGVLVETIQAIITDDDWQPNRTYLVSGTLSREAQTGLHLLATLSHQGETIAECQNRIEEGSPYFDILFNDVPEDLAHIDNVKFILVNA